MSANFWIMAAAGLTCAAFWVLVVAGMASRFRRGGWLRRRGFWMAGARAAQRFALGEIDETSYRRLRDDLRFR